MSGRESVGRVVDFQPVLFWIQLTRRHGNLNYKTKRETGAADVAGLPHTPADAGLISARHDSNTTSAQLQPLHGVDWRANSHDFSILKANAEICMRTLNAVQVCK